MVSWSAWIALRKRIHKEPACVSVIPNKFTFFKHVIWGSSYVHEICEKLLSYEYACNSNKIKYFLNIWFFKNIRVLIPKRINKASYTKVKQKRQPQDVA